MKPLILLTLSVVLMITVGSPASALVIPEQLVFDVRWKGIKAGTAVQTATAYGDEITIANALRSSKLVSTVFAIDDRTESVIARGGKWKGLPVLYRENINEGKRHKQREARFDYSRLTVDSTNILEKTKQKDPITATTHDKLSSIYFIRSVNLMPGKSILFNLYDFKRLWNVEAKVVKREEIRTPLGKFKTIVVTSQLTHNGVPAKIGNGTFWFTDDSRRIPVRIQTTINAGEMILTLVAGSYWPQK